MNTRSIGSIFHTPDVIAFAGDWHANALWANRAVKHANLNGASIILHVGDYGYDYRSSFVHAMEEVCADHDMLILFVRGNHDDPDLLDGLPSNDEGFKPLSKHVWYIPQGTAWTWDGIKFLGLGGAHSVDKPRRVQQDSRHGSTSWWPRETISTVDAFTTAYQGRADVMLTHDCPAGVVIPGLRAGGWDPAQLALAHRHRERLYEIVRKVQPKLLVHGHYHRRYTGLADIGTSEPVRVVGLDCDDQTLVDNMAFATLEHLKQGEFNVRS